MAKLRTKKGPLDTECTEVESGLWRFTAGKFDWQWRDGFGLNLWVRAQGSDKEYENRTGNRDIAEIPFLPALYAKTLDHACLFAWGFDTGVAYGRKGKEDV